MDEFINIYSEDGEKILASVNLITKKILIDQGHQTQEVLPQAYVIFYLFDNFRSPLVSLALKKFNNLSYLSKRIAKQVVLQEAEAGRFVNHEFNNLEKLTNDELVMFLTDCFLTGKKITNRS